LGLRAAVAACGRDQPRPGQVGMGMPCRGGYCGLRRGLLVRCAPVCVALGLRQPGSVWNLDGRPSMAPLEIDHYLHHPALSLSSQAGYTVTTISGDLDIAGVPALRDQLLGVLAPHASRMIIDLSGVTFCDASGLAALVWRRPPRTAAGRRSAPGCPRALSGHSSPSHRPRLALPDLRYPSGGHPGTRSPGRPPSGLAEAGFGRSACRAPARRYRIAAPGGNWG
jgi:ABC-type transporter Mla MlaB component